MDNFFAGIFAFFIVPATLIVIGAGMLCTALGIH